VLNLLGQEANGFLFINWAIASLLFSIPTRTSQSLFSEGSNREQLLARDTKRSFWLVITLLTPGVAFVLLLADKLLLIFGREYSAEGTQLLRLVAISAIPVAINSIYLGVIRVRMELRNVILVPFVVAALTFSLSYILIAIIGLSGAGVSWLSANSLAALLTLPRVIGTVRKKESAAPSFAT
jgi:O-antigen/teichoic acid export membrane protein